MTGRCALAVLLLLAGTFGASVALAEPDGQQMSVFYVGNWLVNESVPPFQDDLAASAGKALHAGVLSGKGRMLYMNLYYFRHGWAYGGVDAWTTGGRGKLQETFEQQPWDALVVQPHGWVGLHRSREQMKQWADDKLQSDLGTDDFGDVFATSVLFSAFLEHHPDGALIVLEDLPQLDQKTGPDGEPVLQDTPAGPEPAPDRQGFDYVRHWERVRYNPDQQDDGRTHSTRHYTHRLMEQLKVRFPDKWQEGKLRCIPVGEVYNAIEKEIRAGKLPGIGGVTFFYSDTFHQRTGLPRYVIAATCYAVLFGERPHALDWSIYNDRDAYGKLGGRNWFYVHVPDFGEHLDITPERAEMVNGAIWETVSAHPYTGVEAVSK